MTSDTKNDLPDPNSDFPIAFNIPAEIASDDTLGKNSLGYSLRRAYAVRSKMFHASFNQYNIRPAQLVILSQLYHAPGLNQSALGEAAKIQRANLVPLVRELEERQLLTRETAAHDRRSRLLRLTEKGEAFAAKLFEIHNQIERDYEKFLGKENKQLLVRMLQSITNCEKLET